MTKDEYLDKLLEENYEKFNSLVESIIDILNNRSEVEAITAIYYVLISIYKKKSEEYSVEEFAEIIKNNLIVIQGLPLN